MSYTFTYLFSSLLLPPFCATSFSGVLFSEPFLFQAFLWRYLLTSFPLHPAARLSITWIPCLQHILDKKISKPSKNWAWEGQGDQSALDTYTHIPSYNIIYPHDPTRCCIHRKPRYSAKICQEYPFLDWSWSFVMWLVLAQGYCMSSTTELRPAQKLA